MGEVFFRTLSWRPTESGAARSSDQGNQSHLRPLSDGYSRVCRMATSLLTATVDVVLGTTVLVPGKSVHTIKSIAVHLAGRQNVTRPLLPADGTRDRAQDAGVAVVDQQRLRSSSRALSSFKTKRPVQLIYSLRSWSLSTRRRKRHLRGSAGELPRFRWQLKDFQFGSGSIPALLLSMRRYHRRLIDEHVRESLESRNGVGRASECCPLSFPCDVSRLLWFVFFASVAKFMSVPSSVSRISFSQRALLIGAQCFCAIRPPRQSSHQEYS